MKKGRCNFENFIRKTSAFFAIFSLSFLTGCSDMVTDYLQDNNILDPDKYSEDKIISEKIEDSDTNGSEETDAGVDAGVGRSAYHGHAQRHRRLSGALRDPAGL